LHEGTKDDGRGDRSRGHRRSHAGTLSLRLGGFRLGYLLNFHVAHMRDGIVRMLNGF
jgi:hypothetical protein